MKLIYMIINYNDYTSTERLINQIKDFKCIDNILVVDNNSTDESVKCLKKLDVKKLDIVVTPNNLGYAFAINFGTKYILSKMNDAKLVVSNSDIVVSNEDDLVRMAKTLDKKNIGIVAPVINTHGELSRGWKMPTTFQNILENISSKFISRKNYDNSHYKDKESVVEVVSGCVFLIKASTISMCNYYDEGTFLYYEENIMAKKLKEHGLITIIDNDATFIHNHSITIDKTFDKMKKYNILKTSQRYYEVNYNKPNILMLFFLDITRWVTYILLYIKYLLFK